MRVEERLYLFEQLLEAHRLGVEVVAAGRQRHVAVGRHGMRAEDDGRLFIDSIDAGSLAERGGLKAGDELVAINDKPLSEWNRPEVAPALKAAGAKIAVMRDGKRVELTLPIEEEPREKPETKK